MMRRTSSFFHRRRRRRRRRHRWRPMSTCVMVFKEKESIQNSFHRNRLNGARSEMGLSSQFETKSYVMFALKKVLSSAIIIGVKINHEKRGAGVKTTNVIRQTKINSFRLTVRQHSRRKY